MAYWISTHNPYLRAVIQLAPEALLLDTARKLDEERTSHGSRGPLHGIPILVKDNIATHPDLGVASTTGGCYGLVGSRVSSSAPAVDRLVKAGAIILGKANLSELGWFKGDGIPSGWSALGGQTQSPYVKGGVRPDDTFSGHSNPGGSSSGSAVSVAAGLVTVSIGTETDGSIVFLGTRAGLFRLKPTIGLVSQDGVIPISKLSDAIGPLAKSPRDVAIMLDAIVDPSTTTIPQGGYVSQLSSELEGLKVGAVDVEPWLLSSFLIKPVESATRQEIDDIERAYKVLGEKLGASFHENIDLVSAKSVGEDADGIDHFGDLTYADFRPLMNEYLEGLEESPIRSLKDMIEFNEAHADKELPPDHPQQNRLVRAQAFHSDPVRYEQSLNYIRRMSRAEGIDKALSQYDIDVIIGPADSFLSTLAAAAGYPLAVFPLGQMKFNGRPFGLVALTRAHGEDKLLRFMSAWEKTFPRRPVPDLSRL
ncbi:amidase signature enzyme [Mollisia scopiformis]|uniref:Amidase signature enzyme n=1 Tax=Mollisia scopiformis TaxID=149040 RepID=A0A194X743_MOLSC|nr:amidase signature enzyme [Mollisia scopiformis]KUJ15904.1 amidase signature enzyme [Mollisia scopiformis]